MARALLVALLLAIPHPASAAFIDSQQAGKTQVQTLSTQQLDSLNSRVFSDAFLAAKIVGFDRSEIDQLKADVAALKAENAYLKSQRATQPTTIMQTTVAPGLEGRVARLEAALTGLQNTLQLVVGMLTSLLTKLQ